MILDIYGHDRKLTIMRFAVGLAISEDFPVVVTAACWPVGVKPHFSTRALDRTRMRDKLLALATTQGDTVEDAVNAALIRVAEKLFLGSHAVNPINGDPPIQAIAPLKYRNKVFRYPHQVQRSHWLMTAAQRASEEWSDQYA